MRPFVSLRILPTVLLTDASSVLVVGVLTSLSSLSADECLLLDFDEELAVGGPAPLSPSPSMVHSERVWVSIMDPSPEVTALSGLSVNSRRDGSFSTNPSTNLN